jgi:undecaprenyl-diphosphatase
LGDAIASGEAVTMDAFYCAVLTFFAGLAAIAFLMALLKRISFLPFVLYRMVLGGFLLVLVYT